MSACHRKFPILSYIPSYIISEGVFKSIGICPAPLSAGTQLIFRAIPPSECVVDPWPHLERSLHVQIQSELCLVRASWIRRVDI